MTRSPEEIASAAAVIAGRRANEPGSFDIAITGFTQDASDIEVVRAYERAGVTWWLESIGDLRGVEEFGESL